uniref:Uncharacterized protein n=1 Tax=Arion vulgaris TaxID=1028688 RepID=A0A0B7BYT4_9EUPU
MTSNHQCQTVGSHLQSKPVTGEVRSCRPNKFLPTEWRSSYGLDDISHIH